ncbi:hypothetical protein DPMN_123653 [Dreissena polymorpha]|uniref:Uncharacterized protein n=1 Tax=Dreissena polymorpha TaxID=45954 RepID=A0A9D4JRH4_DREPO|nr:hypothetical protein DPMN_123653 [Dreissena polymorpha]
MDWLYFSGGGTCSQNGRSCRLEGSKQSLFTWHEPSGFLRFEMFEFPAYCACKSN